MALEIHFVLDAITARESRALTALLADYHGSDSLAAKADKEFRDEVLRSGQALSVIQTGAAVIPAAPPAPPAPEVPSVPPVPAAPPAPSPAAAAPSSTAPVAETAFSSGPAATPPAPPAPTAPAPAAPSAPAAPANPAGVVLDSAGLPWDKRIHSTTKTRNKDETWRQLRNIEKDQPGLVAQVEHELRGWLASAAGAPAATVTPPPPASAPAAPATPASAPAAPATPASAPAAPATPASAPAAPATPAAPTPPPPVPQAPPVPGTPAAPTPPPPPAAAPAAPSEPAFVSTIVQISSMLGQGMISQEEIDTALAAAGITGGSLASLPAQAMVDPGCVARVNAEIDKIINAD